MNYKKIRKLASIQEIIKPFPLSESSQKKVLSDRTEIKNIIEGKDKRLLLIVGPCSAWPKEAVLDYANKLMILNENIKDVLKLVMRVYIQKPRTTKGWSGPFNQANPFDEPDIEEGIKYTRDMMIKVIDMGLPIADEALFIHHAHGFYELLSWVAIGARSTENQEHRIFASMIDCPVGLKNPTHGSLAVSVNSIIAAQSSHVAAFDGYEVQTKGNPYAHLVLRGSNKAPNYSIAHLKEIKYRMDCHAIQNQAVIIDASHDNCFINGKKDHRHQIKVIYDVLENIKDKPELKKIVKGFMIESFIKEGNQTVDIKNPDMFDRGGLSITDPCLSWEQTQELLITLADRVKISLRKL